MLDSIFNRYNSLSTFLRQKFGEKVYKISLNGEFTCPNLDGTKSTDGCIYCNPDSNLPFIGRDKDICVQVEEGIGYVKKRHHAEKFISYFQHFSNTYATKERLREIYSAATKREDVVGLAISTRPDCLTDDAFEVIKEFSEKTFVWLEIGLQSSNEASLKFINRHHTVADFDNAVKKAQELNVLTCAHIIFGLPNETKKEMMETVDHLVRLGIGGVKIHNLHVLKETKLEELYNQGFFKTLELEEYASLVVDALERLPKEVLIHRFNSHSPRQLTVAPDWAVNKLATMNAIHNELVARDAYQGRLAVSRNQAKNTNNLE